MTWNRPLLGVTVSAIALLMNPSSATAQPHPVSITLEIVLPEGETGPIEAHLFACGSLDCAEADTFLRNTLDEQGRHVREEIPSVVVTAPTRWTFQSAPGATSVYWVEAPGYWSPRVCFEARETRVYQIPLVPTGEITGTMAEDLQTDSIEALIQPPPAGDPRPSAKIPCAAPTLGTFLCSVPEGSFVLSVLANGEAVVRPRLVTVQAGTGQPLELVPKGDDP
jgi:hypothetical protein